MIITKNFKTTWEGSYYESSCDFVNPETNEVQGAYVNLDVFGHIEYCCTINCCMKERIVYDHEGWKDLSSEEVFDKILNQLHSKIVESLENPTEEEFEDSLYKEVYEKLFEECESNVEKLKNSKFNKLEYNVKPNKLNYKIALDTHGPLDENDPSVTFYGLEFYMKDEQKYLSASCICKDGRTYNYSVSTVSHLKNQDNNNETLELIPYFCLARTSKYYDLYYEVQKYVESFDSKEKIS